MKPFAACKINIFFIFISCLFFIDIFPVPQNNPYDSFPLYTIAGSDKFFVKKSKFAPSLQITPYYQSASGARNQSGTKVPEGDRVGRWNMLALFFGKGAAPTAKPYEFYPSTNTDNKYNPVYGTTAKTYPYFALAHSVLNGQENDSQDGGEITHYPDPTGDASAATAGKGIEYWKTLFSAVASDLLTQVGLPAEEEEDPTNLSRDFTDEEYFEESDKNTGCFSVPINYEKMGIRGQINLDFSFGLGINIKFGVTDYKQTATFGDRTGGSTDYKDDEFIKEYLMKNYEEILKTELGFNIDNVHETALEDTHIQVYYNLPFDLMNNDGEHVATFIPNFSVGLWCPTGPAQRTNVLFSLPTGNDGFWGITADGALSLDFPGTVQLSFGGGIVAYLSKNLKYQHVPSSIYQTGIYPWKSVLIKKRPGMVWYVNAAFMAHNFLDNLSAYLEYIYMRHNRDSITVKEDTVTRTNYFKPSKMEEDSVWQNSFIQGGLNYAITQGLELGLGFQAHLGGKSVYKTTTILGTIKLNF